MRLAARRFPDVLTRLRERPGDRNQYGEWQPGTVDEDDLRASVQPIRLEDNDSSGPTVLSHRLKVYIPHGRRTARGAFFGSAFGADFDHRRPAGTAPELAAAFGDRQADKVRYNSNVYVVEQSEAWPTYTRAVLLRES